PRQLARSERPGGRVVESRTAKVWIGPARLDRRGFDCVLCVRDCSGCMAENRASAFARATKLSASPSSVAPARLNFREAAVKRPFCLRSRFADVSYWQISLQKSVDGLRE